MSKCSCCTETNTNTDSHWVLYPFFSVSVLVSCLGVAQCECSMKIFATLRLRSRWVHGESNLMVTLSSDKDQRKTTFVQCKCTLTGDLLRWSELDRSPLEVSMFAPPGDCADASVRDTTMLCMRLWSSFRVFSSSS